MERALIIAGAAVAALLASSHMPADAGPVAFTWDPSKATPVLTPGPAAFSVDAISVTNYIRTTNANNLTTLEQTFSGTQIQTINGFTLDGMSVTRRDQFQLRVVFPDQSQPDRSRSMAAER